MGEQPLQNPSGDGRPGQGADGRFVAGNRLGRGNPHGRRVQGLRSAYVKEATPADMRAIARAMIDGAREGDVRAAGEVCDRLLGKPTSTELMERVEALEATASQQQRPGQPGGA